MAKSEKLETKAEKKAEKQAAAPVVPSALDLVGDRPRKVFDPASGGYVLPTTEKD